MDFQSSRLTRIGVFYDGNYYFNVSNYYLYQHSRKARLNISGLHQFIIKKVAELEGTEERYTSIVDSHYFRGRIKSKDAPDKEALFKERSFEDILINEGITTHYLPLVANQEKGIDVWLALEALELAIYKRFDVIVLIAGDGDFLPLIRKLNTIGTRVMLLAWDFKFTYNGVERNTRTASSILQEATYPIMMQDVIDNRVTMNDPVINNLFLPKDFGYKAPIETAQKQPQAVNAAAAANVGKINSLKPENACGFVDYVQDGKVLSLYFSQNAYSAGSSGVSFSELKIGDQVSYELGENYKGLCAVNVTKCG